MTIEAVTAYIEHLDWLHNPSISFLACGYGNDNYRIDDGDNTYVCRVKKTTEFPDSLRNEYTLFLFLENQGYDFCPRAIHLNSEETILIESYITGDELRHEQFSDAQITQFAEQLYSLENLNISELHNFCTQNNLPQLPITTPVDSLQKYGFDRFNTVNPDIVDSEIIEWLQTHLRACYDTVTSTINSEEPHVEWGDVQGSVLLDQDSNMYFFDFEHAMIGYGTDLSYVKIHSSFSPQQFATLIKSYTELSNQSEAEVWRKITQEEQITRVNDVVWAAMKWSETNDKSFKTLTYERQKLVSDTLDLPA